MATNFLNRWSQRKLEQHSHQEIEETPQDCAEQGGEASPCETQVKQASDESSSVASLLVSEAEASVKKAALRKLFLSGQFSEIDGLNDYDHDYKAVKSLSSEVAEKLRDWMNQQDSQPVAEELDSETADTEVDCAEMDEQTPNERAQADKPDQTMGQNIPHKK
ncbi:DUF3306 domain-containing protein [Vibrio sinaloensis]|uniref:DUF3306 domain-containing protein n=1 Tax=Photobacterium sp. (strain ATCC 43367) TaxID=379097 RepID=UPI00206788F4|nr:DUF3306 domain-containing protein [Vibrio sinaloensis]UPQ86750.1 DUF3306 domain-containing protein [Vibrio sinaloensis]